MIRVIFAVLLIVIYYEAFFFLPEQIRVPVKGVFRLRDAILIIVPVFVFFSFSKVRHAIKNNQQAAVFVFTGLYLFVLSPLVAQFFFDQSYLSGFLGFRHRFSYILFFAFSALILTERDVKTFCRIMVFLIAVYILILIAQRSDPKLGLIHFDASWYERGDRFGGRRLFFPYGLVYLMFFFIVLADFLYGTYDKSKIRLFAELLFLGLILRALLFTGTRQFIFLVPIACLFAVWKSSRKHYVLILLIAFFVYKQTIWMVTSDGGTWLEKSRIGRLLNDIPSLDKETGRQFQTQIAIKNFLRSPVFGVGSMIDSKNQIEEYGRRGYFNTPDIGIAKVAAEFGILGVAWVVWAYVFVFRRTGQIIRSAPFGEPEPVSIITARGIRYFYIFLALTSLTLAPFISIDAVPVIALSFALINATADSTKRIN